MSLLNYTVCTENQDKAREHNRNLDSILESMEEYRNNIQNVNGEILNSFPSDDSVSIGSIKCIDEINIAIDTWIKNVNTMKEDSMTKAIELDAIETETRRQEAIKAAKESIKE